MLRFLVLLLCIFGAAGTARAQSAGHQDIAAWGDSLTLGSGASHPGGYTRAAADLFSPPRNIRNLGAEGATSTGVAAHMDAVPILLTFPDDLIPKSGPVTSLVPAPALTWGGILPRGSVCGVAGVLSQTGGSPNGFAFRRNGTGEPAPCPPDSPFLFDDAVKMADRIDWIWMGSNGADAGHSVEDDVSAAVAALGDERYLVGSVLAAADPQLVEANGALNAELARRFGDHYVDLVAALAMAADPADAADVAAGLTPASLRSDLLHLNDKGYAVVAQAFVTATLGLGY